MSFAYGNSVLSKLNYKETTEETPENNQRYQFAKRTNVLQIF